jgi:transposase
MIATEDWMNMHVLAKQGLSYAEIARLVGRDWRTVKRAVAMDSPPRYQRAPRGSKLDPYRPYLDQAVARGVLRATRLFRELQAQGYPGGYELVKIYVRRYKRAQRQQATVRFETLPGVQAQADWGHEGVVWADGTPATVYSFAMVLGYSRLRYVEYTTRQDLPTLLGCHIRAFHAFQGVPREILYDNMKTVVKQRQGHEVTYQDAFLAFAAHYGFLPRACWPYRPQTKGKTERLVGFVHDDFFVGRGCQDLTDLNRQSAMWCTEVNQRPHGTTGVPPVVRWQAEQAALLPLPALDWDPTPIETRLVQRDCFISFEANRYSVPHDYVGRRVTVKADTHQVRIYADTALIATHPLAAGKGQMVLDPTHYADLHPVYQTSAPHPPASPPPVATAVLWAHPALTIAVERRPLAVYEALCEGPGGGPWPN